VAGISLGFGYNNRIINSELESNYMGVVVMNADNNVQVERCVIVDCIVGIYIGGKDRNETKRNETKRPFMLFQTGSEQTMGMQS
jgi:nitrous oxidase accessory protein NosD